MLTGVAMLTLSLALVGCGDKDDSGTSGDGGATTDGGTTDGGSTDGGGTDGGATDGGSTDGGSTDGGATDGGSTDGGGEATDLAGTWRLTRYECGKYDITDDWLAVIPSTVLEISGTDAAALIRLTNSSPSCVEVTESTVSVGDGTLSGTTAGIVSCDPAACQFTAEDAPCEVGDGAGAMAGSVSFTLSGDTLVVSIVGDTSSVCGTLESVQTWARE